MRRLFFTLIMLSLAAAGCQSQHVAYVEPEYDLGHSVTLKGLNGAYVAEVDHQPVDDAQEQIPDVGWNTVLADPGEHHLRVTLNHTAGEQVESRAVGFTFRCEPGHVYEFDAATLGDPLTLKVTDVNLKKSLVIDKSDEPTADDRGPVVASDDPGQMAADPR